MSLKTAPPKLLLMTNWKLIRAFDWH